MTHQDLLVRNFQQGDEQSILFIVNTAYKNLERLIIERVKRLTSPPYFNQ